MNNKKKSKGFTLIELLAVVVILLAISVMAISSISAAVERNKQKQNDTKIAVIESYGKLYYDAHKNSLSASGCLSLNNLGLDETELVDADGERFPGYVKYTNGDNFTYVETCP